MTKLLLQYVIHVITLFLLSQRHITIAQSNNGNISRINLTQNIIGLPLGNPNKESLPLNISNWAATPLSQNTGCAEGYDCVPYFLCKDNLIIQDGTGLIDIRIGANEGCTDSMKLCCAITNLTDIPSIITPRPSSFINKCGIRNNDGIAVRISGDLNNESQFGEFPWMTAILRREITESGNDLLIYQCGGSLINPSVVLTAAHCVSGLATNILKIRAGEWDTQSILEPLPHQDRDIAQVVIHEDYNKGSLKNDIALLFLTSPLDTAENVRPICLPPLDTSFDDRRCYATGWGKDKFGQEGRNQVILKKIDLPVVPYDECQNALRTTRLSKYFDLHDSFICAGGEDGKDTCQGDGGSPLVCTLDGSGNQYFQAGIVSWGIGCGTNNIPGVYTKLSKFRYWIDQIMNTKNLDKSTYIS